jgi:hypothetical protein
VRGVSGVGGAPALALDHVLVAVADLETGARRFEREYGLQALPGGRHPGAGTANMIVPLGSAYLELIAIVDPGEAAQAAGSRRVGRALAEGRTFAAWAVRTPDLDAVRARLRPDHPALPDPVPGARRRPDGVLLRWRTQFLAPPGDPSVLPFLIEWSVPPGMHPSEAPAMHRSGASGIDLVRLGDPDPEGAGERLRRLLGGGVPFAVDRAAAAGVVAVEVRTPGGPLIIA